MKEKINRAIDFLSGYLAFRKGLLPTLGLILILLNWFLQFIPGIGWLIDTNTFLHIGLLLTIIGFMVSWAL